MLSHWDRPTSDSDQQEEDQLPQLRIFVVGTFKDQLVEEGGTRYQQVCERVEGKAVLSLHPEGHSGPAMLSHQQHGRQRMTELTSRASMSTSLLQDRL